MPGIHYSARNDALYHPERRASLLKDPHWPGEIALAAELSRLAYLRAENDPDGSQRKLLQDALQAGGFSQPVLLVDSETDAYGFAARNQDGLCILAFRGTQPDRYEDFITNIQVTFESWPVAGEHSRVHKGFRASATGLWPQTLHWLQEPDTRRHRSRLLVCGHSLGGAIASLLAVPADADTLITFGCPRVGNDAFAHHLETVHGLQLTRVVNCCDAVPTVPIPLMGYAHAGAALRINSKGQVLAHPSEASLHADRQAGRRRYAAFFADDPVHNVPVRDLADHAPINYIRAFWPQE